MSYQVSPAPAMGMCLSCVGTSTTLDLMPFRSSNPLYWYIDRYVYKNIVILLKLSLSCLDRQTPSISRTLTLFPSFGGMHAQDKPGQL
jgi:hypothetical protein